MALYTLLPTREDCTGWGRNKFFPVRLFESLTHDVTEIQLPMELNKAFLILLIFISVKGFPQYKEESDIRDVTRVTFFNPGVSYEKRIAKFQSLYAQAFMNTSFALGFSDALGSTFNIHFDPGFTFQYRYYYNSAKRRAKGKRTEMNSLNYGSAILQTVFSNANVSSSYIPEEKNRAINIAGVVWGFQRNYRKRFSLDLNLGMGYLFTTANISGNAGQSNTRSIGEFTTISQLDLGFWLNKRN